MNDRVFIIAGINLALTAFFYCTYNPITWLTLVHPSLLTSIAFALFVAAGLEGNLLIAYGAGGTIILAWFSHLVMWLAHDPSYGPLTPYVMGVPLVFHIVNLCTVASIVLSNRIQSNLVLMDDGSTQDDV